MNRRTFITQCALGSAGLAAFVQGCQAPLQADTAPAADTEGRDSSMPHPTAPAERPGIDLTAPSVFETATFAMG